MVNKKAKQPGPNHHADAERAILGTILRDNGQLSEIMLELRENDFYVAVHRQIYAAMLKLFAKNDPIDITSLSHEISLDDLDRVGGVRYLADLFDVTAPGTKPDYYADIVRDKSQRRQLVHIGTNLAGDAFDDEQDVTDLITEVDRGLIQLSENDTSKAYISMDQLAAKTIKSIETRWNKEVVGLDTGFTDINEKTGGLQASELIILAARPSMGKTALALNIAQNAAKISGQGVLFFSLEMQDEQLMQRMIAAEYGIDQQRLRRGMFNRGEWPGLLDSANKIANVPLYIDDTANLTVPMIYSKARRLIGELGRNKKPNLGLIVIDYLQLMGADKKLDRHLQISEISRGLKLLAKELEIPVMALSQLNRSLEQRADKRPQLSDLRESGSIEQDADTIMFIYRDELYNENSTKGNIAEIIIGKQRNGPIGTVELRFTPERTSFTNLDKVHSGNDYAERIP